MQINKDNRWERKLSYITLSHSASGDDLHTCHTSASFSCRHRASRPVDSGTWELLKMSPPPYDQRACSLYKTKFRNNNDTSYDNYYNYDWDHWWTCLPWNQCTVHQTPYWQASQGTAGSDSFWQASWACWAGFLVTRLPQAALITPSRLLPCQRRRSGFDFSLDLPTWAIKHTHTHTRTKLRRLCDTIDLVSMPTRIASSDLCYSSS